MFEGNVDKNGLPHGFYRIITPNGEVDFFGCFVSGTLVGNCWKSLIGGIIILNSKMDTLVVDYLFQAVLWLRISVILVVKIPSFSVSLND